MSGSIPDRDMFFLQMSFWTAEACRGCAAGHSCRMSVKKQLFSYLARFRGQQVALTPRVPFRRMVLAGLGAGLAIWLVAALTNLTKQPLIVGSLGATCLFVFGLPETPYSQPRNVIGGHVLAAFIGLVMLKTFGPHPWVVGLALLVAVIAMFATRTVHSPAGANPVIVYTAHAGWSFLFTPILFGSVLIVAVAVLFNNATLPGRYPLFWLGGDAAKKP
jgi:CBS-domain-containing membrane protein